MGVLSKGERAFLCMSPDFLELMGSLPLGVGEFLIICRIGESSDVDLAMGSDFCCLVGMAYEGEDGVDCEEEEEEEEDV